MSKHNNDEFKIDKNLVHELEYWNTNLDEVIIFEFTKRELKSAVIAALTEHSELLERLKYE
jgi:hypothetical protein